MDGKGQCPLCFKSFLVKELIVHVDNCNGATEPEKMDTDASKKRKINDMTKGFDDDDDFQLALKLQREEEGEKTKPISEKHSKQEISDEEFARQLMESEKVQSKAIACQQCAVETKIDELYILDECSHKFCKTCILKYVEDKIQTSVSLVCPLSTCGKELSVRDTKELIPKVQLTGISKVPLGNDGGSAKATERLMHELKHIMKANPKAQGCSVVPIKDNLYHWEVRFFDFDSKELLAQDIAKTKNKCILLHMTFPKTYPMNPPFIRVINPRFVYRTGHVTVGGSICTEMLTNSGWSPANSVESVLVSIRTNLITGGARLDMANKTDYSESEAKIAFDRMVAQHGWKH